MFAKGEGKSGMVDEDSRRHLSSQAYARKKREDVRVEDLEGGQRREPTSIWEHSPKVRQLRNKNKSPVRNLAPLRGDHPASIDLAEMKRTFREEEISQEENSSAQINSNPQKEEFFEEPMRARNKNQYQPAEYLSFSMGRDSSGAIGGLRPAFHFSASEMPSKHLLNAKLISKNTTSTIIISRDKDDFSENSDKYLGKIKGNFSGSIFNIFGPGVRPDAQKGAVKIRELLATIEYSASESSIFTAKKPRNFRAFILKPGCKYYELRGARVEVETPLNELYAQNSDSIDLLVTRKPEWNEAQQAYFLKFEGKVKKSSVKNFILEDENEGNVRMAFGKVREDCYQADLWDPLSPFVGFAIALTSFATSS